MSPEVLVKVGIDVGGTFTHAVAIDARSLKLLGKTKVPTTHRAKEGVAKGIIDSLQQLLQYTGIAPTQVVFIAHSTTQATNALLEGDVAKVGVIGMGTGGNAALARNATTFDDIKLAPGRALKTYSKFLDSRTISTDTLKQCFLELKEAGAEAFAISEAFSVDKPEHEKLALTVAEELGLLATAGSDISQLYGLRTRTRTAILNAAMLPKMLESAELTERCVKEAGITAPLMIMRSDGGVMDINSMRRKPIYTMLSGPAAGVAAALMFLRISDGVFLEVGGTSTDISAIHNGRSKIRSAEVGGNNLLMQTLDIHTIGVAGGSLARVEKNKIIEAGPRSAHIADYKYVAFTGSLENPEIVFQSPLPGDADTYVAVRDPSQSQTLCLTTTCAANLLGFVPTSDCAAGDLNSIAKSFEALGKKLGKNAAECAEEFLNRAVQKCAPVVRKLIHDANLDEKTVMLYGGGGGAAAIVPYLAKRLNLKFELAQSADVLSAIGVALALLRETIERQIVNPSNDDILRLRQQALEAVHAMGAQESTIDVFIEYDSQKSILRATATGATSVLETKTDKSEITSEQKIQLVADSMQLPKEHVKLDVANAHFEVYAAETTESHWLSRLGILGKSGRRLRVLDQSGSLRFQGKDGEASLVKQNQAETAIADVANRWCRWGDAGKVIPNIVVLAGTKIVDLSGVPEIEQITALAKVELEKLPIDADVIVLATVN
jgi:N-methylhydantoinase A/oxoprolinase/acetone carboxylase beta subunit